MRILVAEDERITRAAISRQLQAWGHSVVAAEDGEAAWEQYAQGEFDIVLTDWEMPRLSGLELVERIRATPGAGFVYVVMLTGRSEKTDVVRGIEAGADDFVAKPFDREELRVRLLAGERIVRLERTLSSQNQVLRETQERMRNDLRAASRMQAAMLPGRNIETARVRTAWKYVPTDELAGDGVGLHLIDDRYLVAYVLDVSGHGVPAALLSVSVMHALAPDPPDTSLLREAGGAVRAPELVAGELNRRFQSERHDGRFVTLILCVIDTQEGAVRLVRAGHPLPVLIRGGSVVELADEGGLPLSLVDGMTYESSGFKLEPGDRLCLVSDGLIEQLGGAPGAAPQQFGVARVQGVLSESCSLDVASAAERTLEALRSWATAGKFDDDVSLVMIDWAPDVRSA